MGVDRLTGAFSDGAAFLPYLAAGDPGGDSPTDLETAMERNVRYVEALVRGGADLIELGLPFSEPIADGPTIQAASVRALASGMTPVAFLELVERLPSDIPIVAMTYFNPIFRYGDGSGVSEFIHNAAAAGVDGLIVPDLPVEESDSLVKACAEADMGLIFIAAPTTTDARLGAILERASGYLYVQARLGTTGASTSISDQTRKSLDRIADFEEAHGRPPLPKAVGFGISTGEQAGSIIEAGADGIIVGSALVDIIAQEPDAAAELEEAARSLKTGALAGLESRVTGPERS